MKPDPLTRHSKRQQIIIYIKVIDPNYNEQHYLNVIVLPSLLGLSLNCIIKQMIKDFLFNKIMYATFINNNHTVVQNNLKLNQPSKAHFNMQQTYQLRINLRLSINKSPLCR